MAKIEWKGGKCPVSDGTTVKIYFSDGEVFIESGLASSWIWDHKEGINYIISYEVIEEANEEPKQIIEKTLWDEYALEWMKARDWDKISIAAAVYECAEVANEMMKAREK